MFARSSAACALLTAATMMASASATPAAVTFTSQRTPNGQKIRQQVHIHTTATSIFEQSRQIISEELQDIVKEQVRDLTVIESDPAMTAEVEVTYARATTRDATRRFGRARPQPVDKKTYRVARAGEGLKVTYTDGSPPPAEEVAIVQSDMQAVGRPNPLAQFLDGRTIEVGQQLELPEELAAAWLNQSPAFRNAERVTLRLDRVSRIGGQACGLFELRMEGPPDESSAPVDLCHGEVAVVIATCRTVRTTCDARFAVSQERGPSGATFTVTNRGTAQIEIRAREMSSGLTERWASAWRRFMR